MCTRPPRAGGQSPIGPSTGSPRPPLPRPQCGRPHPSQAPHRATPPPPEATVWAALLPGPPSFLLPIPAEFQHLFTFNNHAT